MASAKHKINAKELEKTIAIPQGIEVVINGNHVFVKGEKGQIKKQFKLLDINLEKKENSVIVKATKMRKKEKKIVNSITSIIKSMIDGVKRPFHYELKICFAHFPMTLKIDEAKKEIVIKNFLGERKERICKIIENVKVENIGDIVKITSVDKEAAGQQAASIEKTTKVSRRDRRVFQDGIWITKKEKGRRDKEEDDN